MALAVFLPIKGNSMGFGGSPKQPELNIPASPFSRLAKTTFDGPFAQVTSNLVKARPGSKAMRLANTARLSQPLQQAANSAQEGFGAGLAYLAEDPSTRFASIAGGNDLYYNVLADQMRSAETAALGRAALQGQSRGLSDSTTQGTAIAKIMDDRLKRERESQLAAFNLGQNTATNQVGTTLGAISGLNALTTPIAQFTGGQLMQGRQFGDNFAMQKAQAEYQAQMAAYQQALANQSGWGTAIGSLSPLGGAIHSGITGNPAGFGAGVSTFNNIVGAMMPTGGFI